MKKTPALFPSMWLALFGLFVLMSAMFVVTETLKTTLYTPNELMSDLSAVFWRSHFYLFILIPSIVRYLILYTKVENIRRFRIVSILQITLYTLFIWAMFIAGGNIALGQPDMMIVSDLSEAYAKILGLMLGLYPAAVSINYLLTVPDTPREKQKRDISRLTEDNSLDESFEAFHYEKLEMQQ